jgi:cellulose biosynthesis protein BcsQ
MIWHLDVAWGEYRFGTRGARSAAPRRAVMLWLGHRGRRDRSGRRVSLEYCKNVLVPVQCEYYALEGLVTLKSTIDQLNEARNLNIKIAGILRTMADWRNNLTHQVSSELEGHFKDLVLNTIIPRNVKLAEAPSYGQSILDYDIKSIGAEAFLSLSGEFIRKFENGRKKTTK